MEGGVSQVIVNTFRAMELLLEEFGGAHFTYFKSILDQVSDITGKGQSQVKSAGVQFFKTLYLYMGPSMGQYLSGLSKFQLQEVTDFMDRNKGRVVCQSNFQGSCVRETGSRIRKMKMTTHVSTIWPNSTRRNWRSTPNWGIGRIRCPS
jgi:hypothetical protein